MSDNKLRIAVLGAAGQTGRACVDRALAAGHDVCAFDRSLEAWNAWQDVYGAPPEKAKLCFGDIVSYASVEAAVAGCDAIIHACVYFPPSAHAAMPDYDKSAKAKSGVELDREDTTCWQVNLKGLWNVLEAARAASIRVVHIGSAQTEHPGGEFYSSSTRRPDGSLYAINKRLQEEMCRQHHEACGTRCVVLRPDYIVDARNGIGRFREPLGQPPCGGDGWVDREDLADAALLACSRGEAFDVLHAVATTAPGRAPPDAVCNVARTRETLGWAPRAQLAGFRPPFVDCHSHAWPAAAAADYPLHPSVGPEALAPLSFAFEELRAMMVAAGVEKAVLIGHGVLHGSDNRYLLAAVAAHPEAFRVSALLDEEGDVVGQMRALLPLGGTSFRIDPWRHGAAMVAKERKAAWLHDAMFDEAARSGQALCALVDPQDIADLSDMRAPPSPSPPPTRHRPSALSQPASSSPPGRAPSSPPPCLQGARGTRARRWWWTTSAVSG